MPALTEVGWVSCTMSEDSSYPVNSILTGKDIDGSDIFAGRAYHEGDLLPAKVITATNRCYVSYDGQEIAKDSCEMMVSLAFSWESGLGSSMPHGAVEVGMTADGETLYLGRVHHDGCVTPGKIHPSHGLCYYPFDGEERCSEEYEALVFV